MMSNIAPQSPALNRGVWRDVEHRIADLWTARYGEIWVVVGCISGAGQPYISHRHRAKRGEGLYRADRISTIKRSQDNPLMKELYEGVMKGKVHELLHVNYVKE
jgi:hypothetical protein